MNIRLFMAGIALAAASCCASEALAGPAAAQGATDESLSYSVDGRYFSGGLPAVFSRGQTLAPGSELTGSLWIRNDRNAEIEVNVRPIGPAASTELYFTIAGASSARLAPEEAAEFTLKVGLPWSAANGSQDQQVPELPVRIEAVESAGHETTPRTPRPQGLGPDRRDHLGVTGFNPVAVLAAAGFAAAGAAALWTARRKDHKRTRRLGGRQ